jgi:hypothetical protein
VRVKQTVEANSIHAVTGLCFHPVMTVSKRKKRGRKREKVRKIVAKGPKAPHVECGA